MNTHRFILLVCILSIGLVSGYRGGNHHGRHHKGRHHGRHHWHHHAPFVNFEVHEPNGLTMSMIQKSHNVTFFGIELFVNQDPTHSNETQCDVCQNTTTVTYGKFILENEDVVIKKGDVLYYKLLLGNDTNVSRLPLQRLWVTDSIIKRCVCETTSQIPLIDLRFGQATGKPDSPPTFGVKPIVSGETTDTPTEFDDDGSENVLFECEIDPATNLCRTVKSEKLSHTDGDLEREVEVLEAIVDKMRKSCGSRDSTNMVRLETIDSDISNTEQLTNYVRSYFSVNKEMQLLANNIRRVFPEKGSSHVFLLDMLSYVDKQKVLYHAQMNNLKQISDYDSRQFGRSGRRG